MKTLINIGTNQGNIQKVEVNKPLEDIKYREVFEIARKKFPEGRLMIHGWVDVSPINKDDYIRTEIVDTIEGVVCEEAYYNAAGEMIGYMAYGKYDPSMPYQGSKEDYLNEIKKEVSMKKPDRTITVTDGVHQVLIEVINPEYVKQLESTNKQLIDALISVNNDLDKGDDWNGEIRIKTICVLHEELEKAGITFDKKPNK